MDLAIYINELLEMHGEISVPGLGSFVYTRMNGYYNDAEKRFYPPSYQLHFDPQSIDDDVLAGYISSRKNISLSSAKYFIDKYVKNLQEQISIYEVAFTDIGYLHNENGKLSFKPKNEKPPVNADFYGYAPVKIFKRNQQPATASAPVYEEVAPAKPEPVLEEITNIAPPVPDQHNLASAEHNYTPEEAVEEIGRQGVNIWLVITIAVIILGATLFIGYRYNPSLFQIKSTLTGKTREKVVVDTPKKKAAVIDTTKTDTSEAGPAKLPPADSLKQDSINRAAKNPGEANAFSGVHFDIMVGPYFKEDEAQNDVKKFKTWGLHPTLLDHVQGNNYHISLGSFNDKTLAIDSLKKITKKHPIAKTSIEQFKSL